MTSTSGICRSPYPRHLSVPEHVTEKNNLKKNLKVSPDMPTFRGEKSDFSDFDCMSRRVPWIEADRGSRRSPVTEPDSVSNQDSSSSEGGKSTSDNQKKRAKTTSDYDSWSFWPSSGSGTLRASLSGTRRKDVVNQCLEFAAADNETCRLLQATAMMSTVTLRAPLSGTFIVNQCLEFGRQCQRSC